MRKMARELLISQLDELEKLVKEMDVPVYKRRNPSWLKKNLAIRNRDHHNFTKVMLIVSELMNKGVYHD